MMDDGLPCRKIPPSFGRIFFCNSRIPYFYRDAGEFYLNLKEVSPIVFINGIVYSAVCDIDKPV
jgi:hypothetical protein